jgi:hypothetical protein
MNLFEMNNGVLQIQPEAYALEPFKALWIRDKSKNKDNAIRELSFVYFMVDYTSDFADILDEATREIEVKKSLNLEATWNPDKIVQEAIEFYKSRQGTVALKLLEDSRLGISKLSNYIRDINFNDVEINEKTGEVKPTHDIKKFADTIKQIPAIISALKELEDTVKKEREAEKGLRGGRSKGMYAD